MQSIIFRPLRAALGEFDMLGVYKKWWEVTAFEKNMNFKTHNLCYDVMQVKCTQPYCTQLGPYMPKAALCFMTQGCQDKT